MADIGSLTKEARAKAVAWLNDKAPALTCPSCRHRNFTLGDHFLAPPVWYGGKMVLGGTSYPMFFVVCDNCFHTMSYSAVATGVLPQEQAQPTPVDASSQPNIGGAK